MEYPTHHESQRPHHQPLATPSFSYPPPPSSPSSTAPSHRQHQPQHYNHSNQYSPPLPPPPNLSIPRRGSSSNLSGLLTSPSSPSSLQSYPHPHSRHSPTSPTAIPLTPVNHNNYHQGHVQEFNLAPPQRSFANFDRSDRPNSVASFSNISTHSNEPLNQPAAPAPAHPKKRFLSGRKAAAAGSKGRYKGGNMQAAADRSLTPQPWHPDYENQGGRGGNGANPLETAEERRRRRADSSDDGDSESGLSEIDQNDRKNRKKQQQQKGDGQGPSKSRKNFFSRLTRSRTKVTYKVSGTGRLAQFSNERLYLHWIRFGILQGMIAVTLLSFGTGVAAYVGVGALTLALTTLIYSTTLYHLRHLYMVTKRKDVVYFARTIPTLLCVGLIGLYLANFLITLSMGETARSDPPWPKDDNFGHYF